MRFRFALKRNGRPTASWTRQQRSRLSVERLERRDVPSFFTAPSYPAGTEADAVAVADFNGDGVADLAVANRVFNANGTVSILLAGPGGYKPPVAYDAGFTPNDVIAADLNGDGKQDLAVTNFSGSSNLRIFLGNGDGTFGNDRNYNVGSWPGTVVAGDLDADGDVDLAVANYLGDSVVSMRNNGNGRFTQVGSTALDTHPHDLVAGDFDGDDDLDLVAVGYVYDNEYFEKKHITVLLGNGNGTFQNSVTYEDLTPTSVAAGDFDADGDLDLAVSHSWYGKVTIWRGNGDGTFLLTGTRDVGPGPYSVAAADLDGDDNLDLVTANGAGTVTILKGTGTGNFNSLATLLAGNSAYFVAVADLDNDVDNDLVVANSTAAGSVTVLRNAGGGAYQAVATYSAGAAPPFGLVVTDFNLDGQPDMAVTNHALPFGTVTVLLGNAGGGYDAGVSYASGSTPRNLAVGDFDRNGIPDLAVPNSIDNGTVTILLGIGDGSFRPPRTFNAGAYPESVAVADFTGDGIQDLAVANNESPGTVSILRGSGTGRFRGPIGFAAGAYTAGIVAADFDGDGDQDVAVTNDNSSNVLRVLLNIGNGSFQPPVNYSAGGSAYGIVIGDFDGDTISDIALTNPHFQGSTVHTLKGNGDGTFQTAVSYAAGKSSLGLAAADIDGDGTLDLVTANQLSNTVSVLRNTGTGTFQTALNFAIGTGPLSVAATDLNGDGHTDVAVTNHQIGGGATMLLNDGNWPPLPIGQPNRPGLPLASDGFATKPPLRADAGIVANIQSRLRESEPHNSTGGSFFIKTQFPESRAAVLKRVQQHDSLDMEL